MRFLRVGKVKIAGLRLPGDWRARLASPHVRDLANSMESLVLIHRPAVRDGDNVIITGRDRLAALSLLGKEVVEVDVFEATDFEVQAATIVENLRRRPDNRDKLLTDLARLYREQEEEQAEETTQEVITAPEVPELPTAATGRPSTPVGRAREKAAAAAGTTAGAVKRAEQRERARAAEPEAPVANPLAELQAAFDEIDGHLRQAKALLTRLTTAHPAVAERFSVHPLRDALSTATSNLRGMRPYVVCPYPHVDQLACPACWNSGWITVDQAAHVPRELRVSGREVSSPPSRAGGKTSVAGAPAVSGQKAGTLYRARLQVRLKDGQGNERNWPDEPEGAA